MKIKNQKNLKTEVNNEMNLIKQLRRNSTPDYFNKADKQLLSDQIRKIVVKTLKKG